MRVLVFGATGDQGQAQLRQLLNAGHQPVAAVRRPAALADLGFRQVPTVTVDYLDPQSLVAAVRDIDAVFLTLPSTSFQAAEPLIAAAEAVGNAVAATGKAALVFNASMIIQDTLRGFSAHDARYEMRRRLFASGARCVSIQPVIYIDNLLRSWAKPAILQDNMIVYPHSEILDVCWICEDDVARLMIAAVDRPALAGRSFNVGGAEAIRGPDLARRLSPVLNRPLHFESQSIADFCARMNTLFKDSATIDTQRLIGELGRIYEWYNTSPERPFFVDMKLVLEELPVKLTRLEDWAAEQSWR